MSGALSPPARLAVALPGQGWPSGSSVTIEPRAEPIAWTGQDLCHDVDFHGAGLFLTNTIDGRTSVLSGASDDNIGRRRREAPRSPGRLPWATLLPRVFAIEVLVCPRCAGPRRIVGAVTEPHAVRRLLGALGLAAQPPPHRSVTAP
jgi:hypothetical protein